MNIPKYSVLGILFLAFATTGCLGSKTTNTDQSMMAPGQISPGVTVAQASGSAANDANNNMTSVQNILATGSDHIIDLTQRGQKTRQNATISGDGIRLTADNADPSEAENMGSLQGSTTSLSRADEISNETMQGQINAGAVSSHMSITNTTTGRTEKIQITRIDLDKLIGTRFIVKNKDNSGGIGGGKVSPHNMPIRTSGGEGGKYSPDEIEYPSLPDGSVLVCRNIGFNNFLDCFFSLADKTNMGDKKDKDSLDRYLKGWTKEDHPVFQAFFYHSGMLTETSLNVKTIETPYLSDTDHQSREDARYEEENGISSTTFLQQAVSEEGKNDPAVIDQR